MSWQQVGGWGSSAPKPGPGIVVQIGIICICYEHLSNGVDGPSAKWLDDVRGAAPQFVVEF